ncbi:MAG: hypothetical protein K9M15_01910 [Candidatus Marinimicrobia bacterium]|nr:hypothetical protein [Candidatus Neomarinimicrobiota bacterium]
MFLKEPKKQLVAVFDIGSASVGSLLFNKRKDKKPEILAISRQPVDYSNKKSVSVMWKSMRTALDTVTKNTHKNFSQKPDVAVCVFSAPWYIPKVKIIKVRRDVPFVIDKDLLKDVIEDEVSILQEDRRYSSAKHGSLFFEKGFLKVKLNGYEVPNPANKKAKLLEMYTYFSLGLKVLVDKIKESVLLYTKDDNVHMHSFPFVLFSVFKKIFDTTEGMLVVDISGDLTDVVLIEKNYIKEISSFPKGENFFIRRVMSALNMEMGEARSAVSQYKRGELSQTLHQKIGEVLKSAGEDWRKTLKELFNDMSKNKALPENLYFLGSAGQLKEIYEPVGGKEFSDFTFLRKPFTVKFMLSKSLKNYFDFKQNTTNKEDVFLLLSSLFADKII